MGTEARASCTGGWWGWTGSWFATPVVRYRYPTRSHTRHTVIYSRAFTASRFSRELLSRSDWETRTTCRMRNKRSSFPLSIRHPRSLSGSFDNVAVGLLPAERSIATFFLHEDTQSYITVWLYNSNHIMSMLDIIWIRFYMSNLITLAVVVKENILGALGILLQFTLYVLIPYIYMPWQKAIDLSRSALI